MCSVPVGEPGDQSSGLAEAARRFRSGDASPEELSLAFVGAVLFCPIGEQGPRVIEAAGSRLVPMYSSELAMARGEGPCEWFSGAGSDLVRVVPAGCGMVVDRGSDSEVVLESWAIRSSVQLDQAVGGDGAHRGEKASGG